MIVKDNKSDKYGIVIKINKKSINVAFSNGVFQGHRLAFSKVNEKDIKVKDIMWERPPIYKESNLWHEGDVGYLVANDKIDQIVLVQNGKNYKGIAIGNTYAYSLTDRQLQALMFDNEKKAKEKLKSLTTK